MKAKQWISTIPALMVLAAGTAWAQSDTGASSSTSDSASQMNAHHPGATRGHAKTTMGKGYGDGARAPGATANGPSGGTGTGGAGNNSDAAAGGNTGMGAGGAGGGGGH